MPRPTAAQLAYGFVTVVGTTLAMLLLSQTTSGAGVAVIALAALALGVLVAVTVPMPRPVRRPPSRQGAEAERGFPPAARIHARSAPSTREPVRGHSGH